MTFRVAIAQCRGTPREVGRQQAQLYAASAKGRAFLRRRPLRLPWWFDLGAEQRAFAKFAPSLWEEIAGLADGLEISMQRAALAFGNGGLRSPIGGCSAIMAEGVYGRNYDFRARHYGARLALVAPKGSYASIGMSELLTGRLDGMNECGLCVGLHLVNLKPRHAGLSCVLITRMVLDQCASTEEACALLRRLPHAMQYSYSMLDAEGEAAVVEAAPGSVAVRSGPWLACTNHFQSSLLRPLSRRAAHSRQRLPTLEVWAREGLGLESTFANLTASSSPAFHHGYLKGAGTLHTIACEPSKRRVMIGIGGDAGLHGVDMLDLNIDLWAQGRDLSITHLEGRLGGTARPFSWPPQRASRGRSQAA